MVRLKRGLIVSCQAEAGSAFFDTDSMVKFSIEALAGGAVALRIREEGHVSLVRKEIPSSVIIGLTKSEYPNGDVYITPTYDDGSKLFDSGADYVAMDATGRNGYGEIYKLSQISVPVIGDISDIKQAKMAIENGCQAITTALSGYTSQCSGYKLSDGPDYRLLTELPGSFPDIPILAEGRYWERGQVKTAFDTGAYCVVVGSAITRPHLITSRLSGVFNER